MGDLELAHLLADAADAITRPAFQSPDLSISTKVDGSVVTNADLEVEATLRELLAERAPGDGVVGEEHGTAPGGDRRWYLDPIDGTSSFAAGRPEWATLIALEDAAGLSVAVASSPSLGRRWWATRDGGAWAGGAGTADLRLWVTPVDRIVDARVSAWPPSHRVGSEWAPVVDGFRERASEAGASVRGVDVKPSRETGFPNAGMLVAAGAIDGFLLCGGGPWDIAAIALLVTEAGGRYSDLHGGPALDTRAGLFSNRLLHDDLLALVSGR